MGHFGCITIDWVTSYTHQPENRPVICAILCEGKSIDLRKFPGFLAPVATLENMVFPTFQRFRRIIRRDFSENTELA
jgi:hypothetical protein